MANIYHKALNSYSAWENSSNPGEPGKVVVAGDTLRKLGFEGTEALMPMLRHNPVLISIADNWSTEELHDIALEQLQRDNRRKGWVARLIANLFAYSDPGGVYWRYVDEVLPDDVGNEYRDKLARELVEAVGRLAEHIAEHAGEPEPPEFATDVINIVKGLTYTAAGGMMALDAALIDWLEAEGFGFSRSADDTRERARERWDNYQRNSDCVELLENWLNPAEQITWQLQPIWLISQHIWENKLHKLWERSRNSIAAVTSQVYANMERVSWRPNRTTEADAEQRQMRLFEAGELVASTSTLPIDSYERLEAVISKGTEELRTMTAIRFMTNLIRQCHSRWVTGEQNPTIFRWNGWTHLADWMGATGNRDLNRLPRILEAGARWEVQWDNGAAIGLWTATTTRGEAGAKGGHAPQIIELRLGAPLAPLWTFEGKHRSVLMPVVELPELDTSAKRWMPAQAALALAVVRELVERRSEIYHHGGAELTPATVERVATRVGCPKPTAHRLMERWTDGSEDAFLEAIEPGRYHLADNEHYGKARRFINETARRSHNARRMGKASARKRKRKSKKPQQ